jgi:hypothetical protein
MLRNVITGEYGSFNGRKTLSKHIERVHVTMGYCLSPSCGASRNLTEEQLRDVAGGGGNGREDKGPVTVDKSNMDGKKNGEAWTPPPGDVSGNSCFFTRR